MNHFKPRRLVSLSITYTVSLVLVFGSVLLSPSVINVALANDMADAPMTKDTINAGSDGDDDNDQGDNDQEDAPVTQDTINVEEASRDNNGEDNSRQNNNDDKPATEIKDVPNCPAGQERPLFEAACKPTSQVNDCGNDLDPINVGCQNTASQIQGDENSVALASEQAFMEDE
jgi:hypothetical protein